MEKIESHLDVYSTRKPSCKAPNLLTPRLILDKVLGSTGDQMTSEAMHPSWTTDGTEVLQRAFEHYGGLETWRALRRVRLFPERLTGFIPRLKGVGKTFSLPRAIEVSPHERRTVFLDYPDQEHVGVFEDGRVRIERPGDAKPLEVSENHRNTFAGFSKYRSWAPMDALYFFGYALWHYHALPFTLGAARLIRTATLGSRNASLSVLHVEFSADVPTHSRRQAFYFSTTGKLVRHDYCADIVGFWARGAHFWNQQSKVDGFPIALERHVFARLGSVPCPPTALHATFSGAEVEWA